MAADRVTRGEIARELCGDLGLPAQGSDLRVVGQWVYRAEKRLVQRGELRRRTIRDCNPSGKRLYSRQEEVPLIKEEVRRALRAHRARTSG